MDLRKTYNVVECAGAAANVTNSGDINRNRAEAINAWINKNFADIFEGTIEKIGSNEVFNIIYFKGTTSGIYIQQNTNTNYNNYRLFRNFT